MIVEFNLTAWFRGCVPRSPGTRPVVPVSRVFWRSRAPESGRPRSQPGCPKRGDPKMIDAGSDSLVQALVDAFVAGGKVKPVLPEGLREEVLAALTRLMINRPLLEEFAAALVAERRRRGVDELLLKLDSPELP